MQPEGLYKIITRGGNPKLRSRIGLLCRPVDAACDSPADVSGVVRQGGNRSDTRYMAGLFFKNGILSRQIAFERHINEIVLVKTQVGMLDIIYLLCDDDGADDQYDRQHKWKNDEAFCKEDRAYAGLQRALQYLDRPECREEEGWIAAGEETR